MNEQLKVIISAEISKYKKGLDDAKKQLHSFNDKVKEAKKNVEDNFNKIGAGINKGLKVAAGAIAGVTTALLANSAATTEYRENQAKLTTAFEANGGAAKEAKNTYNDLYRVLGDSGQATEAAQHLGKLTTEEKALAEWTNICQGVYAEFGDSLAIEGLTEAVNHTAKLGEVQGTLADALEWSGLSVDGFNEKLAACSNESEREKLIRDTLNGIYSDSAANYEENNAQVLAQRDAQAALQEKLAALGETVAPLITAFTSFANDALGAVMPYLQEIGAKLMPVLQEGLTKAAEATEKIMSFLSENWELLATLGGIVGGIAAAIGLYNAVAAVKAAMAAAEVATVWGLVTAYAAQAAAMIVAIAPYVLIVAAIAAVIAIIVLCVKHWDKIKEAVAKAWDFIKEKTQQAVDAVVKWFNNLLTNIKIIASNIWNFIVNIFTNIKNAMSNAIQAAKDIVLSIFDGIKNGIQNKIETAKNIIQNIVKAITSVFRGDFGAAKEAVLNIFDSIKNGIKEKIENAKNTVKNVIDAIKKFFNFKWELPKLKMPSIKITGKFSLSPLSVPKFSISWNKLGGVFDKPTLFNYGGSLQGIGEDGAEAVVPLERNLAWLDKLAGMLSERMGSGTPIILQVDGKTFAQISVDSINQLTRQTGSLPLKLV